MFNEIFVNILHEKEISAYRLSSGTGIPQAMISNWKNGIKKPSYENIIKLSKYLSISSDYLLGLTNNPSPPAKEYSTSDKLRDKIEELSPERQNDIEKQIDYLLFQEKSEIAAQQKRGIDEILAEKKPKKSISDVLAEQKPTRKIAAYGGGVENLLADESLKGISELLEEE